MKNKIDDIVAKGTIFCIHGNSSSSQVFEPLFISSKINNSIIAIDLRGHGENQNKRYSISDFRFGSQKKFVKEILSSVSDGVLLIGNSLGGHIAIELANQLKNIKGLIIMGTPPLKKPINFKEAFLPENKLNCFFNENPREKDVSDAAEILVKSSRKRDLVVSDFNKTNPLVRKAASIDVCENKFEDQYSIYTKLQIPKYILAGDSDPSVNRAYLQKVKEDSLHHDEIIDIVNCGHFPSIDKPLEFVRIVKEIATHVFSK